MSEKVLVIAPHPDDETLGCGGTLLRHRDDGDELGWCILSAMTPEKGFSEQRILQRLEEIKRVREEYQFSFLYKASWPTSFLDTLPIADIIGDLSQAINEFKPHTVYLPYAGDVHTDHSVVFNAGIACTKWFRYPFVKRVLIYETLSETDFCINPDIPGFRPNVFCDISGYLDMKIQIMNIYESECGEHPFPRSEKALRALAAVRGAAAGYEAAESFALLRERG